MVGINHFSMDFVYSANSHSTLTHHRDSSLHILNLVATMAHEVLIPWRTIQLQITNEWLVTNMTSIHIILWRDLIRFHLGRLQVLCSATQISHSLHLALIIKVLDCVVELWDSLQVISTSQRLEQACLWSKTTLSDCLNIWTYMNRRYEVLVGRSSLVIMNSINIWWLFHAEAWSMVQHFSVCGLVHFLLWWQHICLLIKDSSLLNCLL